MFFATLLLVLVFVDYRTTDFHAVTIGATGLTVL